MTDITQADRDMAARIFGAFGIHGEKIVKAGWADDDDIVQAFARHRMEERAAIVAYIRREQLDEYNERTAKETEAWWYANAIEAGEHVAKGGAE